MKVLSTDGLTKLIQLIKSAFISVDDTVTTTTVQLADVATTGDYDDLINTPAEVTESTVSGWGFTKNTGTVTSVNNVSPVNGNVTLTADSVLPSQTSQSGKFLTTNGSTASWVNINDIVFIDFDVTSWSDIEAAIQTGKLVVCRKQLSTNDYEYYSLSEKNFTSGQLQYCKFENGVNYLQAQYDTSGQSSTGVLWYAGVETGLPSQEGHTGQFLTTNGSYISWDNIPTEIPSQSGQSGKYLTTNGTSVSWGTITIPTVDQTYDATSTNAQSGVAIAGAKFLKNNSTNTAGTSYIIGGTSSGVSNTVCIGSGASTSAYSVVVGQGASSTALYSTAIGSTADSNSQFGTAVGYAAKARATSAIQLGTGTNTDSNTLFIGFSDAATNYQLLDGTTGLIPDARISTDIARTSAIPTESTVSGWGFTKNAGTVTSVNNVSPVNGNVSLTIPTVNDATLTIQLNGTTVETFSANASANKTANIQATQVVWRKYTTT